MNRPNYKKIFIDLISIKFPDKKDLLNDHVFEKKEISTMDVIYLHKKLFGKQDVETVKFDQQHKSFDRNAIMSILDFQKKKKMNNKQLAKHFNISKNTVAKWKKLFNTPKQYM